MGLLFTVSVLPDLDLLSFWFVEHRGPTHSLIFVLLVGLPFFVVCSVGMVINKDFQRVLFNKTRKIFWAVPFVAVLGTFFLNIIGNSVELPILLVVPSLFYIVLFAFAMIGLENMGDPVERVQTVSK